MAVDVSAMCDAANSSQGTQTLAIVLSVMFSLYLVVTITLSALTIYSTSQAVQPAQLSPTVGGGTLIPPRIGESMGAPMIPLRSK
tara:strand:+ start:15429 stop:15683 length:255 start_codon:yes stop_codon:yes gene_type:complete